MFYSMAVTSFHKTETSETKLIFQLISKSLNHTMFFCKPEPVADPHKHMAEKPLCL